MRAVFAIASVAAACTAFAQSLDPAPAKLSGRWTWVGPRGAVIDTFHIDFDGDRRASTISARLTWNGLNCGADKEPIEVTWNGTEMRFQAVTKPNVNTQRMNSKCPSEAAQFVLTRKPGGDTFEGEVRQGAGVVTMTAAP